jgi:hypothetical protein
MRYKGIKGKAWEAVKRWARRTYTDCYTCGARDIVSYNAQAGHYQPVALVGSNNYLAWDPDFIRLQCGHCNGAGQGQQVRFRAKLVKEHGEEMVAAFDAQVAAKMVNPIKDWQAVINRFNSL